MNMRQFLRPAALLIACGLGLTPALAQNADPSKKKTEKEETVIIRKSKKGNSEIVIRDGSVFLNGEKVADVQTDGKGEVKRIIIGGENPVFTFSDGDMPMPPRKAMLGVMTDPSSDREGALIRDITPGSAAEKAGLKKGDLITAVDGKQVKDAKDLAEEIGEGHEPGDKVSIQYQRDGKSRATDANLMAANKPQTMREFRIRPGEDFDMPNLMRGLPFLADEAFEPTPKIGLSVEDRADGDGVRVLSVNPGSAAAQAGIKEGDVITKLNQEKLGSVDELQMMMRDHKGGDKLKIDYQRAGRNGSVDLTLPKSLKKKDL